MAWLIQTQGTRAQVQAAVNAASAGNDLGASAQLSDAQTLILSRIASYSGSQYVYFNVVATGFRDLYSDRVNIRVEPITQTALGLPIDGSNVAQSQ
jgi:hypothetical protein